MFMTSCLLPDVDEVIFLFGHNKSNIHTLIKSSILLFVDGSHEQVCGLKGWQVSGQSISVTAVSKKCNDSTRRDRLTTYSFLLDYLLSLPWTFGSPRSVTCPTWSRVRFEFRHPLNSERIELHLQYKKKRLLNPTTNARLLLSYFPFALIIYQELALNLNTVKQCISTFHTAGKMKNIVVVCYVFSKRSVPFGNIEMIMVNLFF